MYLSSAFKRFDPQRGMLGFGGKKSSHRFYIKEQPTRSYYNVTKMTTDPPHCAVSEKAYLYYDFLFRRRYEKENWIRWTEAFAKCRKRRKNINRNDTRANMLISKLTCLCVYVEKSMRIFRCFHTHWHAIGYYSLVACMRYKHTGMVHDGEENIRIKDTRN